MLTSIPHTIWSGDPNSKGLSEGYFPEITALPNTVNGDITYDQYHVHAFLLWLEGKDPNQCRRQPEGRPHFIRGGGGNFQVGGE